MPMIGLFFYVRGRLIPYRIAPEQAEVYGDFLTSSISHDAVWQKGIGADIPVDFDCFPRGRVVYNTREQNYMVYIDSCLNTPEHIAEIIQGFGLADCSYAIGFDQHYQCHQCNREYYL